MRIKPSSIRILFVATTMAILAGGCSSNRSKKGWFDVLDAKRTGIEFTNKLTPTPEFNLFSYMYYYNGAGVGSGDLNNDGRIDIYFSANQGPHALYLNQGDMRFEEVHEKAGIPNTGYWNTGVSLVDINADGKLDIYLCAVGNYKVLKGRNQLFVCDTIDAAGIPHYTERAAEYGLDFSGFSTQSTFFDYDLDGDLDMFLLNHSVNHDGNYAPRDVFENTYDSLAGHRLYRNDGTQSSSGVNRRHFTDVTRSCGIRSTKIGYGLGVAVGDINLDGWPDLYVGNDFHEDDYLYINQKNGTFTEENRKQIGHTSQFSMGVDVADINNDAYPEIISADMLPYDPYMLRRSLSEDDYTIFNQKIRYGYTYQYARNNLQLNRKNGGFGEIGQYAGVQSTDWSWATLWMDFDNDGYKDLFISNGIPKRMNDIDYINFVSSDEIQGKLRDNAIRDEDLTLTNTFPEIKIPNQFYRNNGTLQFVDLSDSLFKNPPTFSNGSAYADLDNDGDLDLVVNNINDRALIYENRNNDGDKKSSFASLQLIGPRENPQAIGARLILYSGDQIRTYEQQSVHGFQSSMIGPMHVGLEKTTIDSAVLIWPDLSWQHINLKKDQRDTIRYTNTLPKFDFLSFSAKRKAASVHLFVDVTDSTEFDYAHHENEFNEFNREALMPAMMSTEGPALAVADINGDGLEDVFAGASKSYPAAVYLQNKSGRFVKMPQPELRRDSMWEHVSAEWVDVNADKHPDLLIATGGNEFYGGDEHQQPLLYLNDGTGSLTRKADAFPGIYSTQSKLAIRDINGDGKVDLFLAGRAEPWTYGRIPRSFLLLNDGTGRFADVTEQYSKELAYPGMVTDATWIDLDGKIELLLSLDWGGIDRYEFDGKRVTRKSVTELHGWWQFIQPFDVDGDGDLDLMAGNFGLNTRLKASAKQPVRLYVNDFDDNGSAEQIMTYYLRGEEICFSSKTQLEKRMPPLKKKYLYAADFAKAHVRDLFPGSKWKQAQTLYADHFSNTVFINDGNGLFRAVVLPERAQLSTYRSAAIMDANTDGRNDLILFGNFHDYNVELGRQDADRGLLLLNRGKGSFEADNIPGLSIDAQVRAIRPIQIQGKQTWILARNDASFRLIR
ncbi:MAG: VCBS repeat-containing protein [Bacteroidota bacterium]